MTQNPDWVNQAPLFDLQDEICGTVMRQNLQGSHNPACNKDVAAKKACSEIRRARNRGQAPKLTFNLRFLLVSLLIPYVIFVQHFASRLPQQALPPWFPIVAAGYFFGTLTLVTVLHNKRRTRRP